MYHHYRKPFPFSLLNISSSFTFLRVGEINDGKQIYEWIPATSSVGLTCKAANMAWLDVTGCGESEVTAHEGVYTLSSPGWRSTISGKLLSALGHVHDGGADVTVYVNGNTVCVIQQLYGRRPGYNSSMDMDGSSMSASRSGSSDE